MKRRFTGSLITFSFIATCLTMSSCSSSSLVKRSPAAETKDSINLLTWAQDIENKVSADSFDSVACTPYLKKLENEIDQFDIRKIDDSDARTNTQKITEILWKVRSELHSKLDKFDKPCVYQIQSTFRQFRFIEDYLEENYAGVFDNVPSEIDFETQPIPMKESRRYYNYRKKEGSGDSPAFKGGDILVTRGMSFMSAMIARLGVRGTQFSHVVFVHENPTTHEIRTIESYVGKGVGYYQIDEALKNENSRILWLRPKNAEIAAKASKVMGDELDERIKNHDPIHYDYGLDFKDHSTMSCAEVSQYAFEKAGMHIPMYPNEIVGSKTLLDHIGLKPGETFEPGDLEIDSRFELMGEFKDLRLTRDSREKDAILTEMFRWMNDEGYEFHDTTMSKAAGGLIFRLRHSFTWPLVKRVLKIKDFSREVPKKMVRTIELLNEIGEDLLEYVQKKDHEFQNDFGWPMTYLDIYKTLDEYRLKDLELYKNKKTRKHSKLHHMFRPKE